ncbi:MAG: MCE family protein [Candidatus Omnitrophica bacterium]|nr:MCE family protein [Candidatus Omnitrophota bacterium]
MKKGRDEMKVGMFVILGFIILTLIVFFISGAFLFRPGYALTVTYEYVNILDKGAPVRMAGVRVGEVNSVALVFDPTEGKTHVRVKLFIAKGVEIRENYSFEIRGTHILSEPHIEISPQPGNAAVLKPGTEIKGVDALPMEDLLKHVENVGADLEVVVKSLRESFEEANLKETFQNFHDSSESMNSLLAKADQGEGTVGKLLTEDGLYEDMRALVQEIKAHPWRLLKRDNERSKFLGIF